MNVFRRLACVLLLAALLVGCDVGAPSAVTPPPLQPSPTVMTTQPAPSAGTAYPAPAETNPYPAPATAPYPGPTSSP
ncbi:MAG TPA: hypothetical protein VF897_07810 [Roseiflexaceae bacterium]